MTKINWENERQRLSERYAGMEDGELEKIASELDSLNSAARVVLQNEMLKRGLQPPPQLTDIASSAKQQSELPMPEILRRYRDLPEAMVAQSILDSAGIESFLADDNLVHMDWLYSNALGGIKLLTRFEDLDVANKLLDETTPGKFDLSGIGEYQQPKCPKCGSMDIAFEESDKHVKAAGFIVGLPLKSTMRGWTCHSCGNRWVDDQPAAAIEESPPQT
jgi:hypothetical protein